MAHTGIGRTYNFLGSHAIYTAINDVYAKNNVFVFLDLHNTGTHNNIAYGQMHKQVDRGSWEFVFKSPLAKRI